MIHTKDSIASLLKTNPRAVERAMVVLYERQTHDERLSSVTTHSNGKGFSAFHASKGTYYAKWCLSGRSLTGRHLESARKMSLHYVGQLLDAAKEKAASR